MTDDQKKQLGENIRIKRHLRKLTLMELGELCGYKGRTAENNVSRWERGICAPPMDKLRLLATALDCSIDEIMP